MLFGSGARFQAVACRASWQKLEAPYCIKGKDKEIQNYCAGYRKTVTHALSPDLGGQ